jgi:hypothetical protein
METVEVKEKEEEAHNPSSKILATAGRSRGKTGQTNESTRIRMVFTN